MAQGLSNLGHTLLALDDRSAARRCFQETLTVSAEMQIMPVVLDGLAGLAALQAADGRGQAALGRLLQIANHPAARRETRDRAGRLCTTLEAVLTPKQIAAAREQAQAVSLEMLVGDSSQS
jgi:hypothetical protein